MAARPSTEGRTGLKPFRLSDIPIGVRRDAGRVLARAASDDGNLAERVVLERAIEFPSDRVYWIPSDAWERERRARMKWK